MVQNSPSRELIVVTVKHLEHVIPVRRDGIARALELQLPEGKEISRIEDTFRKVALYFRRKKENSITIHYFAIFGIA